MRYLAVSLMPRIYFRMTTETKKYHSDWPGLQKSLRRELEALDETDRDWLKERIAAIETAQLALNELFCKAGGLDSCANCDGACCDCGLHHITLTNLLPYLLEGDSPPAPDFERPCPFLGERGCLLTVSRRPYNCITFFCETLEERLSSGECEQLQTLDAQLRHEYQSVADRYPAASLRGLWIALERSGNGSLLKREEKDVVK